MAEDNNNIETVGKDKEQGSKPKGKGVQNLGKRANQIKKVASKLKYIPAIAPIIGILLLIFIIIGLVASFLAMPGMFLGNLKDAAIGIWNSIVTLFDGNVVDRVVSNESEVELAQRIQALGYDIVGTGFSDVSEYDDDGNPKKLEPFSDGKRYLRSYLIANESTYTIAQWSLHGAWDSLFDFSSNAQNYTQGMINIVDDNNGVLDGNFITTHTKIDREKEALIVEPGLLESILFGTFYFDLSTWTSRYGRPVELMLALHLSTMMPDLTYDLATLDEFNTKVEIALNDVGLKFKEVKYKGISIPKNKDDEVNDKGEVTKKGAKTILKENNISLTDDQLNALIGLIDKIELTSWPRIVKVRQHWFYNDFEFEYGKNGNMITKEIAYSSKGDDDPLNDIANDIMIEAQVDGTYYQLCDPTVTGPNDNIVKLFKGDGNIDGKFDGYYYQFDGTRGMAKQIAEAKAADDNKDKYTFGGQEYDVENVTIKKKPVNFHVKTTMADGTQIEGTKNAFEAFSILEGMNSDAAEKIYRNLQELLIALDYFTEEDFQVPSTQVLEWILPNHKPPKWPIRQANEYGAFIKSQNNLKDGFEKGEKVIAPADATIEEIGKNSIKLKLKEVDSSTLEKIQQRLEEDTNLKLDGKCILDMEFFIEGIEVDNSLKVGQEIKRGDEIGKTTEEDIHIIMYNIDKSVVDNLEDYMKPVYGSAGYNPGQWFNPDKEIAIDQLKKDVYKYLRSFGLTEESTFAVMGIIQSESGFNLESENKDDKGFGLLQWTGGRRTNLEKWCGDNGYNYRSVEGQMNFFIYELEKSYSKSNGYTYPVYETLMTSHDIEEALLMFFSHAEAGYNVPISPTHIYAYGVSTQQLVDDRFSNALAFQKKIDELES